MGSINLSNKHVTGFTLVDITNTGVTRDTGGKELERNQQRNWETVLQCISLRAQPMNIQTFDPRDLTELEDLRDWEFGEMYTGKHKIWAFSLRAQPMNIQTFDPRDLTELEDLRDWEFGEMYTGKHKIWAFSFQVEHSDVFAKDGDPLGLLDESFNEVPITTYLTETTKFLLPVFYTSGAIKNIYFKMGTLKLNS